MRRCISSLTALTCGSPRVATKAPINGNPADPRLLRTHHRGPRIPRPPLPARSGTEKLPLGLGHPGMLLPRGYRRIPFGDERSNALQVFKAAQKHEVVAGLRCVLPRQQLRDRRQRAGAVFESCRDRAHQPHSELFGLERRLHIEIFAGLRQPENVTKKFMGQQRRRKQHRGLRGG